MADPSMTRKSNGLDLTPETQAEIWQTAKYQSAFMQLVPEMKLPGNGARVPIIIGDPEAAWVNEGAEKPKSGVTFGKKDMLPYTIAVIMPFSNQFRRDFGALYDQVVAKGPGAIARTFDKTIMGLVDAPGADFDTLKSAQTVSIGKDVWKNLNKADDLVSEADGTVDGWALSTQGRSVLRQATDNNGRPLFLNGTAASDVSTVLGNRTYISKGVHVPAVSETPGPAKAEILGVCGEFSSAAWGSVEGMQTSISDQASIYHRRQAGQPVGAQHVRRANRNRGRLPYPRHQPLRPAHRLTESDMTVEPDVFATSVDLEQRWHKLTDEEREKADIHLADVTDYIKERSPNWQRLQKERPRLLTKITCDIVRRIMQADPYDIPGGITQMNQTTGSFSEQYSFGAPTGDLWLRDDEKRILGINAQRAFSVDMATGETS